MVRVIRPLPVERLKLLVFDLDGTLIDSAQDLCNSVNAALAQYGRGPLGDPAIAGFVAYFVSLIPVLERMGWKPWLERITIFKAYNPVELVTTGASFGF